MSKFLFFAMGVFALVLLAISPRANAQESKKESMEKKKGSSYLVMVPHTAEECLKALDAMSSDSPKMLAKMSFGCMSGDHTGYAIVNAESEEAVKDMIPAAQRDKAKIVKVSKFTPEQIKKLHEKM
jgi:hypothetical protein